MKIEYIEHKFREEARDIIDNAEDYIDDMKVEGFDLTLRQLYYQFISKDSFPDSWIDPETGSKNVERNYKNLGAIISKARLAGLIDWDSIEDRTRSIETPFIWDSIPRIISSVVSSYCLDKWAGQDHRVEVWVEKQALIEVIGQAAHPYNCAYFACKGNVSQSALWQAAQRLEEYEKDGVAPIILYLGDHDPTGMDIARDIRDRLKTFGLRSTKVEWLALTMAQIKKLKLPPSPVKLKDSRSKGYIDLYGSECWELDALRPPDMVKLIQKNILKYVDIDMYNDVLDKQAEGREKLQHVADQFKHEFGEEE